MHIPHSTPHATSGEHHTYTDLHTLRQAHQNKYLHRMDRERTAFHYRPVHNGRNVRKAIKQIKGECRVIKQMLFRIHLNSMHVIKGYLGLLGVITD